MLREEPPNDVALCLREAKVMVVHPKKEKHQDLASHDHGHVQDRAQAPDQGQGLGLAADALEVGQGHAHGQGQGQGRAVGQGHGVGQGQSLAVDQGHGAGPNLEADPEVVAGQGQGQSLGHAVGHDPEVGLGRGLEVGRRRVLLLRVPQRAHLQGHQNREGRVEGKATRFRKYCCVCSPYNQNIMFM